MERQALVKIANDQDQLADLFARQLIEWVVSSESKTFHIALSGGQTPSKLFVLLAETYREVFPWEKIHLWWGDERMVPPYDPESNFGVVSQLLLDKVPLHPGQIHRIHGEAEPAQELLRYAAELETTMPILNGIPRFDLIMLGLGEDGHTASIFPGHLELFYSDDLTALVPHPVSGQKRISLTGKVINRAKRVAFLVTGKAKAGVYRAIMEKRPEAKSFPAAYVEPAGTLYWFIDQACQNS